MGRARSKLSWAGAVAGAAVMLAAVVVVPSGGCSTIPVPACGEDPPGPVCARLGFECGQAVVCYSCGVAKRIDCGSCADTQTCGGGGTPHECFPPLDDGGKPIVGDASADGATTDDGAAADGGAAADASEAEGATSDAATGDAPADGALTSDAAGGNADASGVAEASAEDAAASLDAAEGDANALGPTVVLCSEDAIAPD